MKNEILSAWAEKQVIGYRDENTDALYCNICGTLRCSLPIIEQRPLEGRSCTICESVFIDGSWLLKEAAENKPWLECRKCDHSLPESRLFQKGDRCPKCSDILGQKKEELNKKKWHPQGLHIMFHNSENNPVEGHLYQIGYDQYTLFTLGSYNRYKDTVLTVSRTMQACSVPNGAPYTQAVTKCELETWLNADIYFIEGEQV